jgi:hypothetical protein
MCFGSRRFSTQERRQSADDNVLRRSAASLWHQGGESQVSDEIPVMIRCQPRSGATNYLCFKPLWLWQPAIHACAFALPVHIEPRVRTELCRTVCSFPNYFVLINIVTIASSAHNGPDGVRVHPSSKVLRSLKAAFFIRFSDGRIGAVGLRAPAASKSKLEPAGYVVYDSGPTR